MFAAGEMLDWEAPTGGYLLQAAFSHRGRRRRRGAGLAARRPPRRVSPPPMDATTAVLAPIIAVSGYVVVMRLLEVAFEIDLSRGPNRSGRRTLPAARRVRKTVQATAPKAMAFGVPPLVGGAGKTVPLELGGRARA